MSRNSIIYSRQKIKELHLHRIVKFVIIDEAIRQSRSRIEWKKYISVAYVKRTGLITQCYIIYKRKKPAPFDHQCYINISILSFTGILPLSPFYYNLLFPPSSLFPDFQLRYNRNNTTTTTKKSEKKLCSCTTTWKNRENGSAESVHRLLHAARTVHCGGKMASANGEPWLYEKKMVGKKVVRSGW